MATEIAGAAIKFTGNASPLQAVVKDVARSLYALDAAIAKTGQAEAAKGFAGAIGDTRKELAAANKEALVLSKSMTGLGKAGVGLGFGASAGAMAFQMVVGTTRAVADFAKESVTAAAAAEKLGAEYAVLTGSADKAGQVIADLRQYAKESPLGTEAVLNTGKSLLAMGIAADQIKPTIRALGDVAAGDGERLGRLALAYGQVATAGQLYGTELRQFTEAGVPLLEELAKAMNRPKEAMKGLMEEGKVGFPEVVKAFKNLTGEGGRFAGMSDAYAKTYAGGLERVKDSWESLKRTVGKGLVEDLHLTDQLNRADRAIQNLQSGMEGLRPTLKELGDLFDRAAKFAEKAAGQAPSLPEQPAVDQAPLDRLKFLPKPGGPGTPFVRDVFNTSDPDPRKMLSDEGLAAHERWARRWGWRPDALPPTDVDRSRLGAAELAEYDRRQRQMHEFANTSYADQFRKAFQEWQTYLQRFQRGPDVYALSALGGAAAPHGVALSGVPLTERPSAAPAGRPFSPLAFDVLAERRALEAARSAAPPAPVYSAQSPPGPGRPDFGRELGAVAGGLAGVAAEATRLTDALAAAAGGAVGFGVRLDQLKAPDTVSGRLVKEAAALNQEFRNPLDVMRQKLADLDQMAAAGLIHGDVRNLAAADFLKELAGKSGVDMTLRPVPNAELGSREFANVQAKAFLTTTQGDGASPVDLYRALLEHLAEQGRIGAEQLRELRKLVDSGGRAVDHGPGG